MTRFAYKILARPMRSFDPQFIELVQTCMRLSREKTALEMTVERLEARIDECRRDARQANDELSDLRRDVEQYDDGQRAALQALKDQVQALAELTNTPAATLGPREHRLGAAEVRTGRDRRRPDPFGSGRLFLRSPIAPAKGLRLRPTKLMPSLTPGRRCLGPGVPPPAAATGRSASRSAPRSTRPGHAAGHPV